ncbi:site-2 protease family protein [Candidatus Woesebacteria bacterium]|nr:site-2 protease family protein [Candidatus Woesebacteria bacterium]
MLGTILIFLLVLSILVLVHEFGHFLVARRTGVLVEEFGIGLPPRIFGKKIGETTYSINLLPFGGFVKLHGESGEEKLIHPTRAFVNKSKRVRIAIVIAGVLMNFILATVAFGVVYFFSGIPRETKNVKVLEVRSGSPAEAADFQVGDIVRKVDGKDVSTTNEFITLVEEKRGKEVEIELNLPAQAGTKKILVTPRESPPEGEGPLGVVISTSEIYYPPALVRPFVGIYYGFKESIVWGKTVILGFAKIFTDLAGGTLPKDVAGPVGIFAITSEAAKFGILALINFLGILSVNLAVLNIIPFPALDGGRLLFIGIETFLGRKVVPRVEAIIHTVGMIILLVLIFAITAHDIQRLISAGGITGFIETILK